MSATGKTLRITTLLLAAVSLAACVTTSGGPGQGKTYDIGRVLDVVKGVSTSVEAATMTEEDEIRVGRDVAAQTLGGYPVIPHDGLQRYLNQIGLWVALQSPRPDLPWRFAVVNSDEINAFAVPGGIILVTAGMLELVANEAELACVIGHEVGHVVRKHHLAILQKAALIESGSVLAQGAVRDSDSGEAKRLLLQEGAQLFTRGLDRGAERDADADGVLYAARAGYDPSACLNFMNRMAAQKGKVNALEALYKTHPQAGERVGDVEGTLKRLRGAAPGTGARPPLPQFAAR